MSRSEIHVGFITEQPTLLRSWVKENVESPTIFDSYEESFRLHRETPLRAQESYLVDGEMVRLDIFPVLGPGYRSFYLVVGDKHEANLVSQGLIPPQESPSTPNL